MRITTLLIVCLFPAACGSKAPTPARPEPAPEKVAAGAARSPAVAPPRVDVTAHCAVLTRASAQAVDGARALGTTEHDVDTAVTCLADALDSIQPVIWGSEQAIEFEQTRDAIASSLQSLAGLGIHTYDLAQDADAHALADQARAWVAQH